MRAWTNQQHLPSPQASHHSRGRCMYFQIVLVRNGSPLAKSSTMNSGSSADTTRTSPRSPMAIFLQTLADMWLSELGAEAAAANGAGNGADPISPGRLEWRRVLHKNNLRIGPAQAAADGPGGQPRAASVERGRNCAATGQSMGSEYPRPTRLR